MRRRLIRIFVILCSTTSAIVALPCFMSFWRYDHINIEHHGTLSIHSNWGGLDVSWWRRYELKMSWRSDFPNLDPTPKDFPKITTGKSLDEDEWAYDHKALFGSFSANNLMRFNWMSYDRAVSVPAGDFWLTGYGIFFPYWILLLVLNVPLAVVTALNIRRRRRINRNLCAKCGYDLRASKEICPECGTRFA